MRILIIDDDPERARALREGLGHPGYEIVGEMGPKDDLRREIKRCAAEVILVNISSPDRDIIEQFRESSSENPKPIVMFVDEPGAHMAVDAIDAGVSAYIVDGLEQQILDLAQRERIADVYHHRDADDLG